MPVKEILEKVGVEIKHQASDLASAFVRESVQNPVNGIAEIVTKLSGHKLPELQLVNDKSIQSGCADLLGSTLGKVADFYLFNKLTHGKFAPTTEMTERQVFRNGLQYGMFTGGVLTPVGSTGEDFWDKRMENAEVVGLTYGLGSVGAMYGMKRLTPKFQSEELVRATTSYGSSLSYLAEREIHKEELEQSKLRELTPLKVSLRKLTEMSKVDAIGDSCKTRNGLPSAKFGDYDSISGFTLDPTTPGHDLANPEPNRQMSQTIKSPKVESTVDPKSASQVVPWERRGHDGHYDASALAKRVDRLFHTMGMDKFDTVFVAQSGHDIVLEGRINDKKELSKMIRAANRKGFATEVESNVAVV